MAEHDYSGKLPVEPPEGLVSWLLRKGELSKNLLIYSTEWHKDPLTKENKRFVLLTCTACKQSVLTEKVESDCCRPAYATSGYGFVHPETGELITGRKNCLCPECLAPVESIHCGSITTTTYVCCHALTVSRLDENLVLIGWLVKKQFHKSGDSQLITHPYEAYVVEKRGIVRLKAYTPFMRGTVFHDKWKQLKKFYDSWEIAPLIYPWDKRLLIGSTAENSKFDRYLKDAPKDKRHPITYLRLWQKHPNIENLVMQGASVLLDDGISVHKKNASYTSSNSKALPHLSFIDWKQKKPSKMLGMNRDEFKTALADKWSTFDLSFWQSENREGRYLTASDMQLVMRLGTTRCLEMCNRGEYDYVKVARYLEKQHEKDVLCNWHILSDYWRIARATGEDALHPDVRFPPNLMRAHDRVERVRQCQEEAEKKAEREARIPLFDERYAELSLFAWEHDGIFIRPVRDELELIREGKALKHCVGSYTQTHLKGERPIFVIRRADEPDKPWYTLQLNVKTLTVEQNRGKRNCDRTKDITAFELKWIAHLRQLEKPDTVRVRVAV